LRASKTPQIGPGRKGRTLAAPGPPG